MNLGDEFSFAAGSSIHRVSELFYPRKSAEPAQFLQEAHPNSCSDWFLEWRQRLGGEELS
jgi:hypothetical protein